MTRDSKGITLIEVILGITISALILAMLLAALRLGQRSQEKGLQREDASQRARILGDRVSWLLRGAYPYMVDGPGGKIIHFSGTSESAGFVTSSVEGSSEEPVDAAGLKWVRIFADGEEGLKVEEKMYFSEEVFEPGGGTQYVLDPAVRSLEFEYLDIDAREGIESWATEWDPESRQYLPSAVRVSITLEKDGTEILLPPIIAAVRANRRPAPSGAPQ